MPDHAHAGVHHLSSSCQDTYIAREATEALARAAQAEHVRRRTVGVTGVDNQIRIRPAPGHDFRDRP